MHGYNMAGVLGEGVGDATTTATPGSSRLHGMCAAVPYAGSLPTNHPTISPVAAPDVSSTATSLRFSSRPPSPLSPIFATRLGAFFTSRNKCDSRCCCCCCCRCRCRCRCCCSAAVLVGQAAAADAGDRRLGGAAWGKPTALSADCRGRRRSAARGLRKSLPVNLSTSACTINRPCAQQYVGKYQSCMVISRR